MVFGGRGRLARTRRESGLGQYLYSRYGKPIIEFVVSTDVAGPRLIDLLGLETRERSISARATSKYSRLGLASRSNAYLARIRGIRSSPALCIA